MFTIVNSRTRGSQVKDLVDLVQRTRAAQKNYFKLSGSGVMGVTEGEKIAALRAAVKLELELDNWLALYLQEEARWKAWCLAHYDDGKAADLESLEASEPAEQPNLARLFE